MKRDIGHELNIVSIGVPTFLRNVSKFSNTECIYRVASDGNKYISPLLTKRIARTKSLDFFKKIIREKQQKDEDLDQAFDEACSDTMKGLSIGCFLLEFIAPNGQGETVTMHRFQHSVSIMDTKDNVFNMHQRFFSAEERKSVVFDPNEH